MGCACGCDHCQGGYDHLNPTRVIGEQPAAPPVMAGADPDPYDCYAVPFAYGELVRTDTLVQFVDQAVKLQSPHTEAEQTGAHEYGSVDDLVAAQRAHGLDGYDGPVHRRRLARANGFAQCFMPLEYAFFGQGQ